MGLSVSSTRTTQKIDRKRQQRLQKKKNSPQKRRRKQIPQFIQESDISNRWVQKNLKSTVQKTEQDNGQFDYGIVLKTRSNQIKISYKQHQMIKQKEKRDTSRAEQTLKLSYQSDAIIQSVNSKPRLQKQLLKIKQTSIFHEQASLSKKVVLSPSYSQQSASYLKGKQILQQYKPSQVQSNDRIPYNRKIINMQQTKSTSLIKQKNNVYQQKAQESVNQQDQQWKGNLDSKNNLDEQIATKRYQQLDRLVAKKGSQATSRHRDRTDRSGSQKKLPTINNSPSDRIQVNNTYKQRA